jgi:Rrf2 family protein
MINITSKGRYALKIMIDLALHVEDGKQQRLEIAERQGIPPDYIDQILSRLRASQLIESIRGRYGGFLLDKEPSEISAWDIFAAAEDTLYPVRCMESTGCGCDQSCSTKDIWGDLFSDLEMNLRKKSLTHLVDVWKRSEDKTLVGEGFPTLNRGQKIVRECKAPIKRLADRV